MVKRGLFIAIAVFATVFVFSACARKVEKLPVVREPEEKEKNNMELESMSLTKLRHRVSASTM